MAYGLKALAALADDPCFVPDTRFREFITANNYRISSSDAFFWPPRKWRHMPHTNIHIHRNT